MNRARGAGNITQAQADEALDEVRNYFQQNSGATRFPMNLLASKTYERTMLENADWLGDLDLTDANERSYFESYLAKRKKKI